MIHQYKSNGYNIVMDVNSGAVHVVDDMVYDVVSLYENKDVESIVSELRSKYDETELREAIDEVTSLKDDGQLFTEDIYEPFIDGFKDMLLIRQKGL